MITFLGKVETFFNVFLSFGKCLRAVNKWTRFYVLQRCIIVQWPVWARTSDSRRNLLDCSKQVNFAKIFCGTKRSRRCMNTRSAFKYTYLLTWLLWLNNQLHPMKIITLYSIGFLRILFGGNSAVEMYLNTCSQLSLFWIVLLISIE